MPSVSTKETRTITRSATAIGICLLGAWLLLGMCPSPSEALYGLDNGRALGMRTIRSDFSVDETTRRLEEEIVARGLGIFAIIDHQANAIGVDLDLRPTKLIIFGSPVVGTRLMESNQTIGIDLPLKLLVWEDKSGLVRIGYNKARFLRFRHDIRDRDDVFEGVAGALDAISQSAATD